MLDCEAVTQRRRRDSTLMSQSSQTASTAQAPVLVSEEITPRDDERYLSIVTTGLSEEQIERIVTPNAIFPRQDSVLAVHWHPEFIPMELIVKRIRATFPNCERELIIPTQHNVLESLNGFSGVEIDCYSPEFSRKVQLLAHFREERLGRADVFRNMLAHTFQYRASQLWEFLDTILEPSLENRLQQAAGETGADESLVAFVRSGTAKLKRLIDRHYSATPREMLRNKIIQYYFETLREEFGERQIHRAQVFLKGVKWVVKEYFSFTHFYQTREVIEEVRSLGGGLVIPHPEQFWPILLAGYDVDGYEVWNPQSREYTDFLINVVHLQNQRRENRERPILVFMGDDCHMGEKAKDPSLQDSDKARREIGVQPAWDDLDIRKSLILANIDRHSTITEYANRLG